MCQVNAPASQVRCSECGAGYYEDDYHKCTVYVSFEEWYRELRARADSDIPLRLKDNPIMVASHKALKEVAAWPEWKLQHVHRDQFRYSIQEAA